MRYAKGVFGITFEKLFIVLVIAMFVIGPERLPQYATKFAQFLKMFTEFSQKTKNRMRDEMGSEFDDIDWKTLDPRQYDPRYIIRQTLAEPFVEGSTSDSAKTSVEVMEHNILPAGAIPPFDSEST